MFYFGFTTRIGTLLCYSVKHHIPAVGINLTNSLLSCIESTFWFTKYPVSDAVWKTVRSNPHWARGATTRGFWINQGRLCAKMGLCNRTLCGFSWSQAQRPAQFTSCLSSIDTITVSTVELGALGY